MRSWLKNGCLYKLATDFWFDSWPDRHKQLDVDAGQLVMYVGHDRSDHCFVTLGGGKLCSFERREAKRYAHNFKEIT